MTNKLKKMGNNVSKGTQSTTSTTSTTSTKTPNHVLQSNTANTKCTASPKFTPYVKSVDTYYMSAPHTFFLHSIGDKRTARAIYDFDDCQRNDDKDIAFCFGDILTDIVFMDCDREWAIGSCGDRRGCFPLNYVMFIKPCKLITVRSADVET